VVLQKRKRDMARNAMGRTGRNRAETREERLKVRGAPPAW
jgi:hypothetical protein